MQAFRTGDIPPALLSISGSIPLTQTIFLWQSAVVIVVLISASVLVAYRSAPPAEKAKTAEDFGIRFDSVQSSQLSPKRPGEWLEYSPVLTILVSAMLAWYLVDVFRTSPQGALAALDRQTHELDLQPDGTEGYEKAEVTVGGIDTDELSSKTMESRKVPGLYFIGEVVDVTGHLGGFNFQWAWSSGFAAGQYV